MMRWHFCFWRPVGSASTGTLIPWVPGSQHRQLSGIHGRIQAGLQGDGGLAGPSAETKSGSPFAGQGSNLVWERGKRCEKQGWAGCLSLGDTGSWRGCSVSPRLVVSGFYIFGLCWRDLCEP